METKIKEGEQSLVLSPVENKADDLRGVFTSLSTPPAMKMSLRGHKAEAISIVGWETTSPSARSDMNQAIFEGVSP